MFILSALAIIAVLYLTFRAARHQAAVRALAQEQYSYNLVSWLLGGMFLAAYAFSAFALTCFFGAIQFPDVGWPLALALIPACGLVGLWIHRRVKNWPLALAGGFYNLIPALGIVGFVWVIVVIFVLIAGFFWNKSKLDEQNRRTIIIDRWGNEI